MFRLCSFLSTASILSFSLSMYHIYLNALNDFHSDSKQSIFGCIEMGAAGLRHRTVTTAWRKNSRQCVVHCAFSNKTSSVLHQPAGNTLPLIKLDTECQPSLSDRTQAYKQQPNQGTETLTRHTISRWKLKDTAFNNLFI